MWKVIQNIQENEKNIRILRHSQGETSARQKKLYREYNERITRITNSYLSGSLSVRQYWLSMTEIKLISNCNSLFLEFLEFIFAIGRCCGNKKNGTKNPNLWKVIQNIQENEKNIRILRHSQGETSARQKKLYREYNERITRITNSYLSGSLSVRQYWLSMTEIKLISNCNSLFSVVFDSISQFRIYYFVLFYV